MTNWMSVRGSFICSDGTVKDAAWYDFEKPFTLGGYNCYVSGLPSPKTVSEGTTMSDEVSAQPIKKPLVCGRLGDVNNDGFIGDDDALLVAQYATGVSGAPLTPDQLIRANVTESSVVDITDALFIGQYVAGQRTTFPNCTPDTTVDDTTTTMDDTTITIRTTYDRPGGTTFLTDSLISNIPNYTWLILAGIIVVALLLWKK